MFKKAYKSIHDPSDDVYSRVTMFVVQSFVKLLTQNATNGLSEV